MNDPLVSVICTARNAASTLQMTLQSVRKQTFGNWEMIVVDDGSTDLSASIAESYQRLDPRIRLICSPGLGRGRALNRALDCARAPLVANLDADDLSHPQRLALQAAAMDRDPRIVLLCTGIVRIGRGEHPVWPAIRRLGPSIIDDMTDRLIYSNPVMHSSVMIRREALLSVGGYAEDLVSQFDYELWVRMAKAGYRIQKLDLPLAAKRIHAGQSFEGKRGRVAYLRKSAKIQREAITLLGAPRYHRPLVWGRFLYGLLPRGVRSNLRYWTREGSALLRRPWPTMMRVRLKIAGG